MHQATLSVVGQNMGAKKIDRIKRTAYISMVCVVIIGLVMGLTVFFLHEPLLSIYEPGDTAHNLAVRAAGARRMSVISTTYFLCGMMDVLTGMLRGMGRSTLPMVTSIFTTCILRIAWILTICPLFPRDIGVLYMSYPFTWVVSIITNAVICIIVYKKEKRRFEAELMPPLAATG